MIWTVFYWVLLLLAVGVGLRALFWDRAGFRGLAKLRCRKCWYDLTGSLGDIKENPIQCPECGKKHASRRAMRKTRRSKKWIAAALTLWVGAYAASVTPKVQKSGWGAAVPRIVIVASLPFLSNEQGTGLNLGIGNKRELSIHPSKLDQFVMDQCPPGSGWYGLSAKSNEFGWVSRRVAFLLAKLEPDSLLSDGTTAKGCAYKRLLSHIVDSGKAYTFEKQWAQQVVYCEIAIDNEFSAQEVLQGDFEIRRLLASSYRIQAGDYGEIVYQCNTPHSLWTNGRQARDMSQEEIDVYWINRFLWDSRFEIEKARGRRSHDEQPVFGVGTQIGATTGEKRIVMTIMDNEGTHQDPRWVRVHRIDQTVQYAIDPNKVLAIDLSQKLRDQIQNEIKANLTVEYDSQQQAWVPVIQLSMKNKADRSDDVVMFGGMVSVRYVRTDYVETNGRALLSSNHDQTWWRWGKIQEKDPEDITIEIDGQEQVFTMRQPPSVRKLIQRSERNTFIPGELYTQYILPSSMDSHYKLVVRIDSMQRNTQWTYGGLWGDRVFEGELEFPLERWSYIELKRYIINGVVPDHAMP